MTRVDHAAEAANILARLNRVPHSHEQAMVETARAGVHAQLALVDQQRIANLTFMYRNGITDRGGLYYNAQTIIDAPNPIYELHPWIAAALGISTKEEEADASPVGEPK